MATTIETVADLLERLGDIPARRVRLKPGPGTATERDVMAIHDRENRLYELVDGTLVEKVMGYPESRLAAWLLHFLTNFLMLRDLGDVTGPDGTVRLFPGLVRIPDVAFTSWARLPATREPVPDLAPDLAVEILSEGNTAKEMARKLDEYFRSGVRLVWIADPRKRTVRVYTAPERFTLLTEADTLDGGDVLPGFRLVIREWFERAERQGPR